MKVLRVIPGIFLSLLMFSCGNENDQKIHEFAESFAGYVNSGQMDSIKLVYPSVNFDSIQPLMTDSIKIVKENDISYINFGNGREIEVKEDENGRLIIVNSKNIALFPQDKYKIGVETGMITDSIPDTRVQELLNDADFFIWMDEQVKNSFESVIEISEKDNKNGRNGEGVNGKMEILIKNNLPITIDSKLYTIQYTMYQPPMGEDPTGWRGTRTKAGIPVEAGQSTTTTITDYGYLSNPKAVLKMPIDEFVLNYYKPTGKEYQDYLKEKK